MSKIPVTKEERNARAQIVRLYQSSCEIANPDKEELRFRETLQFASLYRGGSGSQPDEDTLRERAHLVRLYESNARIKYPSDADVEFRRRLHREIGEVFGLAEIRKQMPVSAPTSARSEAPKKVAPPRAPVATASAN